MTTPKFLPRSSSRPSLAGRAPTAWAGRLARWLLPVVAATLWPLHPLLAGPAPLNDALAGALPLEGSTNTVTGSNVGATREAGEPDHAGNPSAASVWWNWVAPDSGTVIVETLGTSFDTVLAVYTGNSVEALTPVAFNDDAPGLATSLLSFSARQGTTYRLAVDGYQGASGPIRLSLRLPVTPQPPRITTQPEGQIVPDKAGSNVTFSVAVTGSFPRTFTWQKNEVNLPAGTGDSYTITNVTLADDARYRVIITNYQGSVTSSVALLTVRSGLGQDFFEGRVALTGTTNTATAHSYGATLEAGEPVHAGIANGASLWWSWTAPQHGLTRLDTAGSLASHGEVLDTVLAVYMGDRINALSPVATNNDEMTEAIPSSQLVFRAVAGQTYQIAVAGARNLEGTVAVGDITLHLAQAPDNDAFANALPFPPDATAVLDDNTGASLEPGEPLHGGKSGGKSVWWSWVAPTNGTYVLDTVGSATETVLAVYTGSNVQSLALVGEDDHRSDGGSALVKFFAVSGTLYHFVIDGYTGSNGVASGQIVLNLNPSLELNDDFADRTTLSGQTNLVTGSNVGASKEPGEPQHGGNPGGRSVWWTWTAHYTGPVSVSTRNSTFDTDLAVYTGTQLASLVLIAENDDADPFNPNAGSQVLFQGVAGQTYQIAVDSYRFDEGTIGEGTVVLSLAQATPPVLGGNDLFANRFSITGSSNTVVGANLNSSKEAGEPDHAGNDGGKSVWWSWVAPASTPVTIVTLDSTFDTLLAVYQGTNVNALTLVADDTRSAGGGRSIVTFEAVQGVEYQIAVDGFNDGTGADAGQVVLLLHQYPPGALHANDAFESSTPIADPFLTVNGFNIGATRQPGEPSHGGATRGHSVWWSWTAQADGPVTMSTAQSQFDTILAVYTGSELGALSLVAQNDDIDPGELLSSVTFQAVAGTVYHIAVDGYGQEIGLVILNVSPGADTPAAPRIEQAPATQTRFSGGGGGGTNVTFRVVATGSAPMTFQWQHDGVNLPGATNDLLTLTNAGALQGGLYRVSVSNGLGSVTSPGAALHWVELPFNDDFARRIPIPGSSNQVFGSLEAAGKQANEPHHGGETGGRSVWWTWTAPSNGMVEMHTVGSSGDTLLAVYQGNDISNLALLAENNDLVEDSLYASRVVFNAVAGQSYQIAVDGMKTNTEASVQLTVKQPGSPWILTQPAAQNVVHVTNTTYTLQVAALGLDPLRYQWFLNGTPLPNATNASHVLGALSRAQSGSYSVSITDVSGTITSSPAQVWVQVPQRLHTPRSLANGRVQLPFSDPDGSLAPDATRFEVQSTLSLTDSGTPWLPVPGPILRVNGQFIAEDQINTTNTTRYYRVIER